MNLKTIEQKLDANVYGEQSIVTDDLGAFLWTGFKTYILSKHYDELLVDRIISGAEIVESEADSQYNEEIDFPSISYIPFTREFEYANKVSTSFTQTVNGRTSNLLDIFEISTDSLQESSGKFLIEVEITAGEEVWQYYVDVRQGDGIATATDVSELTIETTIYPKPTTRVAGQNSKTVDSKSPLFFDASEQDVNEVLQLRVFLPQLLGREYVVKTTLTDYYNFDSNFTVALMGVPFIAPRVEDNEIDTTFIVGSAEPSLPERPLTGFDPEIIDFTYATYVMEDVDVEEFLMYLTTITNMTSDEYQNGGEQYEAVSRFNGKLLNVPTYLVQKIPDELKSSKVSKRKGAFQGGTRLIGKAFY